METQKLSNQLERKLSIDSEPRTLTKEELDKARVCILYPRMCLRTHLSAIYVGKLFFSLVENVGKLLICSSLFLFSVS